MFSEQSLVADVNGSTVTALRGEELQVFGSRDFIGKNDGLRLSRISASSLLILLLTEELLREESQVFSI